MTDHLLGVAELLSRQAELNPAGRCLIAGDDEWTYRRVATQARALAVALHRLGVEPGDRVAVQLPNWPEMVLSAIAVADLGAVLVPVSPTASRRELRFILRNTEAVAAITPENWAGIDFLDLYEGLLATLPALQYVATVGEEDLWYGDRIYQFEDLVSSGRGRGLGAAEIDYLKDPYAILYTAGTTGTPKGVVLSQGSLVRTARESALGLQLGEHDVTLCCVPMANIFGTLAMLSSFNTGGTLLLQDTFSPTGVLDLADHHQATVLHGVPTMFVLLLRELERGAIRPQHLRTGLVAGSPVGEDLIRRVRAELVPDAEIAYGLTETSSTVTMTAPSDPSAKRSQTAGRPLPDVEVIVLNPDMSEAAVETVGELAVRGYNVMQGYFRQPGQTQKTMTDKGFLRTGDLALLDEEGYLHIVGRLSDVVLRGGYSVHPAEIETLLRSHPVVEKAVVVGIPHDVLGELICACVVISEGALITADELREFCRESLAGHKVPDAVHFMDDFPDAKTDPALRARLARMVRQKGGGGADSKTVEAGGEYKAN